MFYQKFGGSLMTQNANSYTGSASNHEVNALYKVQHWKLEEDLPDYQEQECVEWNTKR
jgi:hypothetical protein